MCGWLRRCAASIRVARASGAPVSSPAWRTQGWPSPAVHPFARQHGEHMGCPVRRCTHLLASTAGTWGGNDHISDNSEQLRCGQHAAPNRDDILANVLAHVPWRLRGGRFAERLDGLFGPLRPRRRSHAGILVARASQVVGGGGVRHCEEIAHNQRGGETCKARRGQIRR